MTDKVTENPATCASPTGPARMLEAKLWRNPCWFSFRLNYLALLYNTPLYGWIKRSRDLSRAEYVVLYSLALSEGGQARDISDTSGFPKNTLSRAIARLEKLALIRREHRPGQGRNQPLSLSPEGWALFNATLPAFEAHERRMLAALTPDEQDTLAHLLAKVVIGAEDLPHTIDDQRTDDQSTGDQSTDFDDQTAPPDRTVNRKAQG